MALSGSKVVAVGSYWDITLEWTATQNATNNTSTVTAKLYWNSNSTYGAVSSSATKNWSITIDGTKVSGTATASLTANQSKLIGTASKVVTHASDGSKSLAVSGIFDMAISLSGTYYSSKTASGSWALNTIPRTSTASLSTTSFTAGVTNATTISITRASSAFTHDIKFVFGAWNTTVTGVATSYAWTPAISLIDQMGASNTGTGTVTVTTKSGATVIGSKTYSFTLSAPAKSAFTLSTQSPIAGVVDATTTTIFRNSASYTHDITYTFGTKTTTVTGTPSTTHAWSPPLSLLSEMAVSSNSGKGIVTVTTKYGTKIIGTNDMAFTLYAPSISTGILSFTSFNVGTVSATTLAISKGHADYTHDVSFTVKTSVTTTTGITGVTQAYSPPMSLLSLMTSNSEGGTVTLTTKYGTKIIGVNTYSFTVNAPSESTGSLSSASFFAGTTNATTLNISKSHADYTHEVSFNVGGTISSFPNVTGTSQAWSPAITLINSMDVGSSSISGTVLLTTKYGTKIIGSRTYSFTLNAPAKSTSSISASSVDFGTAVTITTALSNPNYRHNITYRFVTETENAITTGSIATSVPWTPATSLMNSIPNATNGIAIITVGTYYGTRLIGYNTHTLTLNVPSTILPSISAFALTDGNTTVKTLMANAKYFVQGISSLNFTSTATGNSGSTIKEYSVTFGGKIATATTSSISFGAIGTAIANGTATLTVTDSRGRTRTATITGLYVLEYSAPSIKSFEPTRTNPVTTVAITSTGSYSPLMVGTVGKNILTYNVKYKPRANTTYVNGFTLTYTGGVTFGNPANTLTGINGSVSYDVQLIVTDTIGNSVSITKTVSTMDVLIDLNKTGIGIGKVWEQGVLDAKGLSVFRGSKVSYKNNLKAYENHAMYYTGATATTGAIVINTGLQNIMLDCEIALQSYNYMGNIHLKGYTYSGGANWYLPAVKAEFTSSNGSELSVRAVKNASNERLIIIGDASTVWSGYLHVSVPRITVGYGTNDLSVLSEWNISIETALTGYTDSSIYKEVYMDNNLKVPKIIANIGTIATVNATNVNTTNLDANMVVVGNTLQADKLMGTSSVTSKVVTATTSMSTPTINATTSVTTPTVSATSSVTTPTINATSTVNAPTVNATTELKSPKVTSSSTVTASSSMTAPTLNATTSLVTPKIDLGSADLTYNSDGSMRFANVYGYIDIGSKNTAYAHIYTDRPMFYMNQKLSVASLESRATLDVGSKLTVASNGNMVSLKGNDHVYIEFFGSQTASPNTRTGWIGNGSTASGSMTMISEVGDAIVQSSKGDVYLKTGTAGGTQRQFVFGNTTTGYLRYATAGASLKFFEVATTGIQARNFTDTAYVPLGASAFNTNSSRAVKRNIEPLTQSSMGRTILDEIDTTPIYTYHHVNDDDIDIKRVGMMLDEAPYEVLNDAETLNLYSMVGMLWRGTQEMIVRVKELEEKVAQLSPK